LLRSKNSAGTGQSCSKDWILWLPADGKYGNARFLRPLQGQNCGVVVRLRQDRVLYRQAEQPRKRQRGRPRVHGERFAFKKPASWETPQEVTSFEHAQVIWQAYTYRWPVEPSIRFRKQHLAWTTPQFQHKEIGDRWSWLVVLAVWLLYLSRPIIKDQPLPWQKPQCKLTPQRVQQSLPLIFAQFGSPARKPKTRGKSPAWPKGRQRTPKQRFTVLKKQSAVA
jgi:hypothetical protein